jgi:hypothetical protein
MNCDEAFEALTDPSQQNSDALQRHLENCNRCMQMREVLAPALNLLVTDENADSFTDEFFSHENLESAESEKPMFLSPAAVQVAERAAEECAVSSTQVAPQTLARKSRNATILRSIVGTLLGVVLILSGWNFVSNGDLNKNGVLAADQCTWQSHDSSKSAPSDSTSREVVLSCVSCHLKGTVE